MKPKKTGKFMYRSAIYGGWKTVDITNIPYSGLEFTLPASPPILFWPITIRVDDTLDSDWMDVAVTDK